jgi:hypothetical protein
MKARILLVISTVNLAVMLNTLAPVAQGRKPGDNGNAVTVQQQTDDVELLGQIGGSVIAVARQGNYAYVGIGPRLVVLDVSDPIHPLLVGQTSVMPGCVRGVDVVRSYAYVAAWEAGLRIISISNPAAPRELRLCR